MGDGIDLNVLMQCLGGDSRTGTRRTVLIDNSP